jgi:hypothetical protein
MAIDAKFAHLLEIHQDLLRQFVTTELDLAITFCERALTVNQERSGTATDVVNRNLENGIKAFESASRAISRSGSPIENEPNISERIKKAKSLLSQLKH